MARQNNNNEDQNPYYHGAAGQGGYEYGYGQASPVQPTPVPVPAAAQWWPRDDRDLGYRLVPDNIPAQRPAYTLPPHPPLHGNDIVIEHHRGILDSLNIKRSNSNAPLVRNRLPAQDRDGGLEWVLHESMKTDAAHKANVGNPEMSMHDQQISWAVKESMEIAPKSPPRVNTGMTIADQQYDWAIKDSLATVKTQNHITLPKLAPAPVPAQEFNDERYVQQCISTPEHAPPPPPPLNFEEEQQQWALYDSLDTHNRSNHMAAKHNPVPMPHPPPPLNEKPSFEEEQQQWALYDSLETHNRNNHVAVKHNSAPVPPPPLNAKPSFKEQQQWIFSKSFDAHNCHAPEPSPPRLNTKSSFEEQQQQWALYDSIETHSRNNHVAVKQNPAPMLPPPPPLNTKSSFEEQEQWALSEYFDAQNRHAFKPASPPPLPAKIASPQKVFVHHHNDEDTNEQAYLTAVNNSLGGVKLSMSDKGRALGPGQTYKKAARNLDEERKALEVYNDWTKKRAKRGEILEGEKEKDWWTARTILR